MTTTKAQGIVALLVLLLWGLAGCVSPPPQSPPALSEKNPAEQLATLKADIDGARKNNLNVMAPTRFAKVEAFYNKAREGMSRESDLGAILIQISSARAHLQLAEESAQIAGSALGSAIKARDLARQAGAEHLGEDYQEAEERFLDLTRSIEKDNLRWAQKNEVRVARMFDQLELRAIKDKALSEARELIARAEKQQAARLTPLTLKQARSQLETAEAYITQHRYHQEEIAELARKTLFEARRLNRVLEQSERLKVMSAEQAALWMEHFLSRAAEGLTSADRRDEAFDVQAASILGVIATWQDDYRELAEELEDKAAEIDNLKAAIAELEGRSLEEQSERDRLAAERRFQGLFNEVQGFFAPGEAEVYKQGNNLIVRLKAIRFPVGQEVILPENYGLLSKVQQAIRLFDQPQVVIEGHTDSTGSEEKNRELSQKRAAAVREYLVANRTLPADKMQAVGFGSVRPLASNQTPEGRAVNRRIDLVITPVAAATN